MVGNAHPYADRPQWKLMPEGQGSELDVSADRCRVVKCITVNRVSDADKEVCTSACLCVAVTIRGQTRQRHMINK